MNSEEHNNKKTNNKANDTDKLIKELQDYNISFYNLFNGIANPLIITDRYGNFIEANPSFIKFFNIPGSEIKKKNIRDIQTESSNLHDEFPVFLKTGHQSGTTKILLPDSHHLIKYNAFPLAKNRYLISFIDITNEVNTEKEKTDLNIFFNSLINNIKQGIGIYDSDLKLINLNDNYKNYFDIITSGNISNSNLINNSLPTKTFNSGEIYEKNITVNKENSLYNFLVSSFPVNDEKGNVTNALITIDDITNIVHSDIEIETRTALINTLLDSLPTAVFYKDINGFYKGCNKEFEFITGKSRDEIIGKKTSDLFETDDAKLYSEMDSQVTEYGDIKKFSHQRMHHGKNEIRNFLLTKATYYDINNNSAGVIGIVEDLTEIETAQWDLENAKKYAANIINEANIIIIGFDETGKVIEFNKKAEIISGYSKEEIMNKSWRDIPFFISNTDFTKSYFYKTLSSDISENKEFELNISTKSGFNKVIFWHTGKFPLNKDSAGYFFFGFDNTELKLKESKLRNMVHAVEQSNESIILTDPEGRIQYVNNSFTSLTGYASSDVIGKNPRFLKSGNTPKEHYKELWDTILSGNTWRGELQNKKKNGELYWEYASITPVKDENKKIVSIIAMKTDVTVLKNTLNEIGEVKERINELSSLKTALLSNISHEFRTPLIGIIGFADILKNEITNSWHLDMVSDIYSQAKRLLNTLSLVIRLSQLESKELKPEIREVNILDLVRGIIPGFLKRIEDKKLKLVFEEPTSKITCRSDLMMLKEIITNILDNAVKFTDSGTISIEIGELTEGIDKFSSIKITDTGIGIHQDKHDSIFMEFKQVSNGMDKKYGGAGLGLTISKYLIELLYGKILLSSSPGKGSAFTILIPLTNNIRIISTKNISVPEKEQENDNETNILIIEDSLSNISIMENYLAGISNVESVLKGEDAIKLAGVIKFDAVLMDINLGAGINGITTMNVLKRHKDFSDVPFIAITGYDLVKDKNFILSEGFNDFLAKPFSKKDFLNLILKYLPDGK